MLEEGAYRSKGEIAEAEAAEFSTASPPIADHTKATTANPRELANKRHGGFFTADAYRVCHCGKSGRDRGFV